LRDREQAEAALRQHALIAHGEVETAVQLRRAG
jgi:hypothetical protein